MVKILDSVHRIACSDNVPSDIRQIMPEKQATVFYLHQKDYLVLNTQNKNYEFYKDILFGYLSMENLQKKRSP